MTIATIGIDLGKTLNSVVGMDATGRVVLRRRVRRANLKELRVSSCCVLGVKWHRGGKSDVFVAKHI